MKRLPNPGYIDPNIASSIPHSVVQISANV